MMLSSVLNAQEQFKPEISYEDYKIDYTYGDYIYNIDLSNISAFVESKGAILTSIVPLGNRKYSIQMYSIYTERSLATTYDYSDRVKPSREQYLSAYERKKRASYQSYKDEQLKKEKLRIKKENARIAYRNKVERYNELRKKYGTALLDYLQNDFAKDFLDSESVGYFKTSFPSYPTSEFKITEESYAHFDSIIKEFINAPGDSFFNTRASSKYSSTPNSSNYNYKVEFVNSITNDLLVFDYLHPLLSMKDLQLWDGVPLNWMNDREKLMLGVLDSDKFETDIYPIWLITYDGLRELKHSTIEKVKSELGQGIEGNVKPEKFVMHKVRKGETLYSLSRYYSISEDQIKEFNPLVIRVGVKYKMTIKIPVYPIVPTFEAVPIKEGNIKYMVKVQPRETKWRLAYRYGITIQELEQLNPQIKDGLKIGQEIVIPKKTMEYKYDIINKQYKFRLSKDLLYLKDFERYWKIRQEILYYDNLNEDQIKRWSVDSTFIPQKLKYGKFENLFIEDSLKHINYLAEIKRQKLERINNFKANKDDFDVFENQDYEYTNYKIKLLRIADFTATREDFYTNEQWLVYKVKKDRNDRIVNFEASIFDFDDPFDYKYEYLPKLQAKQLKWYANNRLPSFTKFIRVFKKKDKFFAEFKFYKGNKIKQIRMDKIEIDGLIIDIEKHFDNAFKAYKSKSQ